MSSSTSTPLSPSPQAQVTEQAPAARKVQYWELAVLGAVLLGATGHLLIKAGLNAATRAGTGASLAERLFDYIQQPAVFFGIAIYGLGTAMWVFAVSKKEISYLFPLSALNYVAVAVGGMVLFGELIPAGRWLGIAVVVAGVVLMQRSGREESE